MIPFKGGGGPARSPVLLGAVPVAAARGGAQPDWAGGRRAEGGAAGGVGARRRTRALAQATRPGALPAVRVR